MSRPGTGTAALILWVLAAILGIVGAIIGFVALGAAGAAAAASGTSGALLLGGAIVALIIAVVQIAVLVKFAQGRNWARILLTIIGILAIIGAVNSGSNGQGTSWFTIAFYVLAIVLSFVGGANDYFRRRA